MCACGANSILCDAMHMDAFVREGVHLDSGVVKCVAGVAPCSHDFRWGEGRDPRGQGLNDTSWNPFIFAAILPVLSRAPAERLTLCYIVSMPAVETVLLLP
eukprot:gene17420-biopygen17333